MTAFLKQVARHYYAEKDNIRSSCFIFPNRRALVFFKKYLGECVAADSAALVAPQCCTINDFFYSLSGSRPTDRVLQLVNLYDCYKPLYDNATGGQAETLDEFIFWGGVLLSDFNDVDKYLVDPEQLFRNIADWREMQDSLDYLSETQKEALENFLKHFTSGNQGEYKQKFRRIWDILLPLYRNYNSYLESKGMCYEGQVYRRLAERLSSESVADIASQRYPDVKRYVFVGLNALNECEKRLLNRMHDAGLAEFCWDYSSAWIRDADNKSSLFMRDNVSRYPQAFTLDAEGLPEPKFNILSIPSSTGQAKQLPAILKELGRADIQTAIVLPDENLLIPVLNSIPEDVTDINVTMGYPLSGSELWSLMSDIASLQMHLRCKDGTWHFYHKQVWSILSNPLVDAILSEEGKAAVQKIREDLQYYVPQASFAPDPVLAVIFQPEAKDPSAAGEEQIAGISAYLMEVLRTVAPRLKELPDMQLELDFAREYYLAVQRLRKDSRPMLPSSYFRLLQQLVSGASVPFKGEPLKGLQIMGPLETRALDFENVVILSCNEGVFPRRSVSSSFIPPELRRGFSLPTYEYQDAVWAYYFYRLIQRSRNVWMLYDSRTEGLRSGEPSRYIRQLEMHFGAQIRKYVGKAPVRTAAVPDSIPKTQEHIDILHQHHLSASALQNYLWCPAKFYYSSVQRLKEIEEVAENLDAGTLGNSFHETMEELYTTPQKCVTDEYLQGLLDDPDRIRDTVSDKICGQLHCFEVTGRNLIFRDMVCKYVRKSIEKDLELMKENGTHRIDILGLELDKYDNIGGYKFIGYIDRLDSPAPGLVRVVDYKTGRVDDEDFIINDDNAGIVVEKLFGPKNSERPKIALQLYLYDRFIRTDKRTKGKELMNSIYSPARLFVSGVENVRLSPEFCTLMDGRLQELLDEISNLQLPWKRCADSKDCEWCDYKNICGR